MLHSRRTRQAKLAEREALGESFWAEKFNQHARTRILHAFDDSTDNYDVFYMLARGLILRDEGLMHLINGNFDKRSDLLGYLMKCPDEMMPTVIEAMSTACADRSLSAQTGIFDRQGAFNSVVNVILREHRISYELIDTQMVEFSSRELHVQVVSPALQLLAGRPDLSSVETAYRDALAQLSKGEWANAITDAGTALQEMLCALGCIGNALGPLIKSAKAKSLLAAHDKPMLDSLEKLMHWVSADRSEKGDAHHVATTTVDDAWLIVHIVGAIVLRLSKSIPRGTA